MSFRPGGDRLRLFETIENDGKVCTPLAPDGANPVKLVRHDTNAVDNVPHTALREELRFAQRRNNGRPLWRRHRDTGGLQTFSRLEMRPERDSKFAEPPLHSISISPKAVFVQDK